ncbi:MAG: hypothetical protein AB7E59_08825 [Pusillimonas sp.]
MTQIQHLNNKYTEDRLRLTEEPEYIEDLLKVYDDLVAIEKDKGPQGSRNRELLTALDLLNRIATYQLQYNPRPSKALSDRYSLCRDKAQETICCHCWVQPQQYFRDVETKTLLDALRDAGMISKDYISHRWGDDRTDAEKMEAAEMAAKSWQEVAILYHKIASEGLVPDPMAKGGDGYRLYQKYLHLPQTLNINDSENQIVRE